MNDQEKLPPPKKRKGKVTVAESAQRLNDVIKQMCNHALDHEIEEFMREKYDVHPRTVARYVATARVPLCEATDKPREQHISEALGVYSTIVADPNEKAMVRLKAQTRIDKLLGLESPMKVAQTTVDGSDIVDIDEAKARLEALGLPQLPDKSDGNDGQ